MRKNYFLLLLSLTLALLTPVTSQAQAPAWASAITGSTATGNGESKIQAMATDANGNIYVTGFFYSYILFGSTGLYSSGNADMFLAKYVPSTNTWAWAVRGGGSGYDYSYGLAVSGSNIYLTGTLENDQTNYFRVTLGGTTLMGGPYSQAGTSTTGQVSADLFLAKFTDTGNSAIPVWCQVGGGTGTDSGTGVAVSGSSVYLTGYYSNNQANSKAAVLGGTGLTPGTMPLLGATTTLSLDWLLAKYTDSGATATLSWTQTVGGSNADQGSAIAVSGSSIYATGYLVNDTANSFGALLGGTASTAGTMVVRGATANASEDLLLVKYTDNGSSATPAWTQVGGGIGNDRGNSLAINGSSIYVGGALWNNRTNNGQALFGGNGTTLGTVPQAGVSATSSDDLLLTKYTDNGSTATFNWAQVGGGDLSLETASAVAVRGTQVYITGILTNSPNNNTNVLFGGTGLAPGTLMQMGNGGGAPDIVVASYTDNGASSTSNWTQLGGGIYSDVSASLLLLNNRLYVGGATTAPSSFGAWNLTTPPGHLINVVASLPIPTPLATLPNTGQTTLRLYPNPATGPATLEAAPGTSVYILDALGRLVATATTSTTGVAALPTELSSGLYLVRAGTATVRWTVE